MKVICSFYNESRSFEIKKQHFLCQVWSILKNKSLSDIEIELLKKEIDVNEM